MIQRLYVDNYKTLSNFEIKLDGLNFLLGANGSGKSSVFEVLTHLRQFVGGERASLIFWPDSKTRWDRRLRQTFELELESSRGRYRYILEIAHSSNGPGAKVARELLELDGRGLLTFDDGTITLGDSGQTFVVDKTRSALSILGDSGTYEEMNRFREIIDQIYAFKPQPGEMDGRSTQERERPGVDLRHFGAWYRYLLPNRPGTMHKVQQALREAIPGFEQLRIANLGANRRELVLDRSSDIESDSEATETYRFNELSDGEKLLIGLYTIVVGLRNPRAIICIDEPLNYLSLVELEPLLGEMENNYYDEAKRPQVLLASHHPVLVDFFAERFGLHFRRKRGGPTTVSDFQPDVESKLSTSEILRQGWEKL